MYCTNSVALVGGNTRGVNRRLETVKRSDGRLTTGRAISDEKYDPTALYKCGVTNPVENHSCSMILPLLRISYPF